MTQKEQRELARTTHWANAHYTRDHRFTAHDLRVLHRRWLGEIYPWAGQYRQVNVSKGGFLFAATHLIPHLMKEFEADCLGKYTPLNMCTPTEIAFALAKTHAELVLIHPFREGNGRLARLLAVLMAEQAGLPPLSFEHLRRRREIEYFAAVRAGLDRNYIPLSRLFASVIAGDDAA
jgi:cell filamentation protein